MLLLSSWTLGRALRGCTFGLSARRIRRVRHRRAPLARRGRPNRIRPLRVRVCAGRDNNLASLFHLRFVGTTSRLEGAWAAAYIITKIRAVQGELKFSRTPARAFGCNTEPLSMPLQLKRKTSFPQRRKDAKKNNLSFLCVFAPLREIFLKSAS